MGILYTIKVIKRDGRKVYFDSRKIYNALIKASKDTKQRLGETDLTPDECERLTEKIEQFLVLLEEEQITVEQIQDYVVKLLKGQGYINESNLYNEYRQERTKIRDKKSNLMKMINAISVETDRDNANVGNNFSAKMLRIASEASKWRNLASMPKELSKLHENGDLYYHDLDSYNLTTNCLHVPTGELLKRGFNTGYGTIKPPKRIGTAAELSCIILQSSQNDMFGGQSHPNFDNDLAPYLRMTELEVIKKLGPNASDDEVYNEVMIELHQAMQGVVYNLNTMHSRAGSQVPFSSINIGLPKSSQAADICQAFLEEYEKGLGKGEQPIFPNIIFRVKKGVNAREEDPYYYLYKLACRVAAKRMNPTFMNIDADFNKEYYDKGYMPATMGCRTYLMKNVNGKPGVEGRGNIAPVTINLPRLGIKAKGNIDKFFDLFEERIIDAKDSLLHRYDVLKELKVKDLPFVAGQKLIRGSEDLKSNDSIEPILKQGTWGIGFIGLAETLVALTGKHHGEDENSRELGVRIITYLRKRCDEFTDEYKLNFSCYATPAEGLSGKFIKQDQKLFGKIDGVTDKDYYTNSFHVPVGYPISITKKIDIEAPYHKLCNGGHISYIEVDDSPSPETVQSIIDYAYEKTNISYVGINFHMRYCKDCGETLHSSDRACPKCGGTNIQGISRVTGYLSLDERFGAGKSAERHDRISHQYNHTKPYSNIK